MRDTNTEREGLLQQRGYFNTLPLVHKSAAFPIFCMESPANGL